MAKSAGEKLEWIKAKWAAGRTVYLTTHTRSVKLRPVKDEWALKVGSSGHLLIARGRHWDIADYCAITAG